MGKSVKNRGEGSGSTMLLISLGILIVAAATVFVLCIVTTFTVSGKVKPLIDRKEAAKLQGTQNDKEEALSMQMQDIVIQKGDAAASEEATEAATETSWKEAEYAMPGSDTRLLTEDELKNMSKEQLMVGRNEILARHGRIFREDELRLHFESKSWYQGTVDPDEFDADMDNIVNSIELANLNLIKTFE